MDKSHLDKLLAHGVKSGASDLHFRVGDPPAYRIDGVLRNVKHPPLSVENTRDVALILLGDPSAVDRIDELQEHDASYSIGGIARFRVNVYRQRGSLCCILRVISGQIPSLEALKIPAQVRKLAEEERGLVLVTGATGSGKSSTLAAMIDHINQTRSAHILTIEDPIEFLLTDQLALITQREVNTDTTSFSSALRAALRQDPDVIMVGEMRDQETVLTAMQAAETGHLVMSTLHTADAAETITRVISMFPPGLQGDVRFRLATCLRAIVSMRLIKSSVDSQRYPAVEVLRNTELVRSLIEQREKTKDLRGAMETGFSQYGMQTFDQSLFKLYKDGLISADDALAQASYPEDLRLKLQGIVGSAEKL